MRYIHDGPSKSQSAHGLPAPGFSERTARRFDATTAPQSARSSWAATCERSSSNALGDGLLRFWKLDSALQAVHPDCATFKAHIHWTFRRRIRAHPGARVGHGRALNGRRARHHFRRRRSRDTGSPTFTHVDEVGVMIGQARPFPHCFML